MTDELISRQAAIDALGVEPLAYTEYEQGLHDKWIDAKQNIEVLPSAQPERLTDDDIETIRIHLNAQKERLCNLHRWEEAEEYQRIIDRLVAFVSAQPEQRWIPCSERLPEEETDVLVTRTFLGCKDGSHGWNSHIPPKTYVEVAQYFDGEWTALSDEYKVARNRHTDPVAWMPLPKPWKGEKDEQ